MNQKNTTRSKDTLTPDGSRQKITNGTSNTLSNGKDTTIIPGNPGKNWNRTPVNQNRSWVQMMMISTWRRISTRNILMHHIIMTQKRRGSLHRPLVPKGKEKRQSDEPNRIRIWNLRSWGGYCDEITISTEIFSSNYVIGIT